MDVRLGLDKEKTITPLPSLNWNAYVCMQYQIYVQALERKLCIPFPVLM